MAKFSLERLVDDTAAGKIKGCEFFVDPAHGGKPDHIDLSVRMPSGEVRKYTGLSGVQELREAMPFLQPGQHRGW